jgi:hypothetical protein
MAAMDLDMDLPEDCFDEDLLESGIEGSLLWGIYLRTCSDTRCGRLFQNDIGTKRLQKSN